MPKARLHTVVNPSRQSSVSCTISKHFTLRLLYSLSYSWMNIFKIVFILHSIINGGFLLKVY